MEPVNIRRVAIGTVAAAVFAVVGAGPAMAYSASRTGSASWTSGSVVYNKDTNADGNYTSAPYVKSAGGSESLVNRSGANATVSRNAGSDVTAVKACVSRPAPLAMACTDWNSVG